MIVHKVKVYPSKKHLPKKKQLAWKLAELAKDNSKLNKKSIDMVINRIIDNASVAIASLNRKAVISSREMALKHPKNNGATLFGINSKLKFDCEWAAWSNGTAVRELDSTAADRQCADSVNFASPVFASDVNARLSSWPVLVLYTDGFM